jgi:hypothetical protein
VLITNQDPDAPVLASLSLGAGAAAFELDAATGAAAPALDDAPALGSAGTFSWMIEAGDARLLLF